MRQQIMKGRTRSIKGQAVKDEVDQTNWPTCSFENCSETVNPKRVKIMGFKPGQERCLQHGDVRKQFTVAPAYNKGGLQLITHGDIEDIGR